MSEGLLAESLAVAIFMEIATLRSMGEEARQGWARPALAECGDELLLAAQSDLLTAARAIAVLALQPGGVRFAGRRWCAAHNGMLWTGAAGKRCPRCLRETPARRAAAADGPTA